MKEKIKIVMGVPSYLIKTKEDLKEIKENAINELLSQFSYLDITKENIDVVVKESNDSFYMKIVDEDEGLLEEGKDATSTKIRFSEEPIDLKKVLDKDDKEKDSFIVNDDITKDQEKTCIEDDNISICELDAPEGPEGLTKFGENIALLKLFLMLSDSSRCEELHSNYGTFGLDSFEKSFLLKKLFVESGLISSIERVKEILEK